MKKLMILSFLTLFFAPMVWGQERCEAPVWCVGDKWTYKYATGGTWTHEIIEVREGLIIEKRGGSRDLYAYDPTTLNLKAIFTYSSSEASVGGVGEASGELDRVGDWVGEGESQGWVKEPDSKYGSTWKSLLAEGARESKPGYVLRKLFNFPIFVGKKWADMTYSTPSRFQTEVTFIHDFKVEGMDKTSTPTGIFKTYRIRYKQTNMASYGGSNSSGWIMFWYSPEVKNWVKREVENAKYWQNVFSSATLTSYSVK